MEALTKRGRTLHLSSEEDSIETAGGHIYVTMCQRFALVVEPDVNGRRLAWHRMTRDMERCVRCLKEQERRANHA